MAQVTKLHYARGRRVLELAFDDGLEAALSAEFLRVHSPSAEVRGHGPGQETLQSGKAQVEIVDIKPVGHYAVQLVFSDQHDSGLFTWAYLRELAANERRLWSDYLEAIEQAGLSRHPDEQVLHFQP